MPTPRWKGTKAIKEDPNSPVFDNTKDGKRFTKIFNGPYNTLFAAQPPRLAGMTNVPTGFFVDTVKVEKQPGGKGKMTVTLVPSPAPDVLSGGSAEGNQTMEVEWIEIQKKLETHPMFNAVSSTSVHPNAGKYPLNDRDLDLIEQWKDASTASARATAYSALSSHDGGSSGNAIYFVDRLRRGMDSYVEYAPVIRVTTRTTSQPTSTQCGLISDPPAEVKVDGYVYLSTADRSQRDANWSRSQEYTGADRVDDEVYPYA